MLLNMGQAIINVHTIQDFPYNKIPVQSIESNSKSYVNVVATFDIETTNVREWEHPVFNSDWAFMYVWQFCIEGYVCIGRTWAEYREFLDKLKDSLSINYKKKLVVYVHNLQFEFQFMRNFFKVTNVFARKKRDVIRCEMEDVEYRCSYALTNMKLSKFLETTKGVTVFKLDGDEFDYSKKRYPDTPLTEMELKYCVADVYGLYQALKTKLLDDTLITIPMTSTGYVRREFRDALNSEEGYRQQLNRMALNKHTYSLCAEAVRGGISGSNALHTGYTLEDVISRDIKSSYPYQMATKYFPQSAFMKVTPEDEEEFHSYLDNWCCLILWEAEDIHLKEWDCIPYISQAKCRAIYKGYSGAFGNGKVYAADRIGMCCTEIDFKIIEDSYYFDNLIIHEMWVAKRGMLSKTFRQHLMNMFQMKTNLERGDPYLYAKYKNMINATYGMMLTAILHAEIQYSNTLEPWTKIPVEDVDDGLKKHYRSKNTFLSFQHGVWVTAHARKCLYDAMKLVGEDIVQVDTDSVKFIGNHDYQFNQLNQKIMSDAETYDIKPYAMRGDQKVYLGIWEQDAVYSEFKTLGAKKYVYRNEPGGEMKITVSGLRKKANTWLDTHGGFNAFKVGTVVPANESGRTAAKYVDVVMPHLVMLNGHEIVVASNVCIVDATYTIGVTDEWLEMIDNEE